MSTQGYFDYNATTPLSDGVKAAMLDIMSSFVNPSSSSRAAKQLKEQIAKARQLIRQLLNAKEGEVFFTSGGTESNNLAIKGILQQHIRKPGHIACSAIEHPSVLETVKHLHDCFGFKITLVEPDAQGIITVRDMVKAITGQTQLICLMMANNETGALQPIEEVGYIAKHRNIPFSIDGVQAVGKLTIDVSRLHFSTLSFSSHKFYGPKGVGGLYIKKGVPLMPLLHGGGQEGGLRGGTENTIGILGMAVAVREVISHLSQWQAKQRAQKKYLLTELQRRGVAFQLNGPEQEDRQTSNTLNLSFEGVRGEALAALLEHRYSISISIGSACSNNKQTNRSHVLQTMGLPDARIDSAVRISFGRFTEDQDVIKLAESLCASITMLQRLAGNLSSEVA